jgi:hypothetical protein
MKPEAADASSALNASAPSLGATSGPPMSDEAFLSYLDPNNKYYEDPMYQDALYRITEHSPNAMQDALSLLKLGNEAGSRGVREYFQHVLDDVVYKIINSFDVSARTDDLSYRTESLTEALAANWSLETLRAEAGDCFYSNGSVIDDMLRVHARIKSESSDKDYEFDLPYWKAIGAFTLMNLPYRRGLEDADAEEIQETVQWLETKEYLGDIIRVGVERGLNDVEGIRAILESDAPPSLSSGAL